MGGDDGAVLAPPVASTGRGRLRRAAEPWGPPPDSGRLPAGTGAKAAFPSAFEGASAEQGTEKTAEKSRENEKRVAKRGSEQEAQDMHVRDQMEA